MHKLDLTTHGWKTCRSSPSQISIVTLANGPDSNAFYMMNARDSLCRYDIQNDTWTMIKELYNQQISIIGQL